MSPDDRFDDPEAADRLPEFLEFLLADVPGVVLRSPEPRQRVVVVDHGFYESFRADG